MHGTFYVGARGMLYVEGAAMLRIRPRIAPMPAAYGARDVSRHVFTSAKNEKKQAEQLASLAKTKRETTSKARMTTKSKAHVVLM